MDRAKLRKPSSASTGSELKPEMITLSGSPTGPAPILPDNFVKVIFRDFLLTSVI
jgi:hypothetical protein